MGWMSLWMLLALAGFVAAAAGAVYLGIVLTRRGDDTVEAHELLERRFASGEIDAEEYAARQRVLRDREQPKT